LLDASSVPTDDSDLPDPRLRPRDAAQDSRLLPAGRGVNPTFLALVVAWAIALLLLAYAIVHFSGFA
jgi:hypothetical protein